MIDLTTQDIALVEARSDTEFVRAVFDLYAARRLFAIQRPESVGDPRLASAQKVTLPPSTGPGWVREKIDPIRSDEPAQIVFSSGTEGRPKALVLSHRNLADVVDRLNAVMQVTSEIREYVGVPVTYSFGLGRVRAVAAVGGASYLPATFDPSEIRQMLDAGEINAISAVPSLWRIVLSAPDLMAPVADRVRWIEIGSQFMSAEEKQALRTMFPAARIVQHYGLTEASRSTFLDISEADSAVLGSVGPSGGPVTARIDDEGAICLHGENVALGLLEEDGSLVPVANADGWLTTRDRGEIRNGHLYFLGRMDDQMNLSGIKVGAEALEREIAQMVQGIADRFAITGIEDPLRGEAVLLVAEDQITDRLPLLEAAARLALKRRGVAIGQGLHLQTIDTLPRTGTNKIRRADLRHKGPASTAASEDAPKTVLLTPDQQAVAQVWQKVMGVSSVAPEQCFYDLGGDSLSSIHVSLSMEGAGFNRQSVRATLEGASLAEVGHLSGLSDDSPARMEPERAALPDQTVRQWGLSLTRAVMVLSVLLSHWSPGVMIRLQTPVWLDTMLGVVYRMGTPAFAVVFGIGVGAYMLPTYRTRPKAVIRRAWLSFWLVLAGFVLNAALLLIVAPLQGRIITELVIAQAFFNVLGFYVLALGTLWLWLPALARSRRPVVLLLLLAPLSWVAWQVAQMVIPDSKLESLLEWPRLMLVAHYSIFKISTVMVLGMAAGIWLSQQSDTRRAMRQLAFVGGVGGLICLLSMFEAYGLRGFYSRWGRALDSLPGLIFYTAVTLLLLSFFLWLVARWHDLPSPVRVLLQLGIVTGGLALPIFVFHGLVIPAKEILFLTVVSGPWDLLVPLAVFLGGISYAGWRLYRVYFR